MNSKSSYTQLYTPVPPSFFPAQKRKYAVLQEVYMKKSLENKFEHTLQNLFLSHVQILASAPKEAKEISELLQPKTNGSAIKPATEE